MNFNGQLTAFVKAFHAFLCSIGMKVFSVTVLALISVAAMAQNNSWTDLGRVEIFSNYDPLQGMVVKKPIISDEIMALSGHKITVSGFIIVLDTKTSMNEFLFSRYPQNMCFFCGAAGPETAMQVTLKNERKINYTKDQIKVKGRLKVVKDEPSGLIYFLEDAEVIKT